MINIRAVAIILLRFIVVRISYIWKVAASRCTHKPHIYKTFNQNSKESLMGSVNILYDQI